MRLGIILGMFSGCLYVIAYKRSPLNMALFLVTTILVLAPVIFVRSKRLDNFLKCNKVEGLFFKRIKVPPSFQRLLYGYDKESGAALALVFVQFSALLTLVISCLSLLLCILDMALRTIDFSTEWWEMVFVILSLSLLGVEIIRNILHFVALIYRISKGDTELRDYLLGRGRYKPEKISFFGMNAKKILQEHEWQISLKNQMKKYLYHREKGVYYLNPVDIHRIEETISNEYPNASCESISNEKGEKIFTVYAKDDHRLLFQAPVKKHR